MELESGVSLEEKLGDIEIETSVFDFPNEIIEKIFFHLGLADRCKMRLNKKLYGIVERMKKTSLINRKIDIIGHHSSSDLRIRVGYKYEKVSFSQAIRLVNFFKFRTIEFEPYKVEQLSLIGNMRGVTTDYFRIPQLYWKKNCISAHFDRSIICNLMQIGQIVKIMRVCVSLTAEDLKHIYETAKNNENFCGIALRVTRNTARQFVMTQMGKGDKMKDKGGWVVDKTEGQFEIRVSCGSHHPYYHKFTLRNTGCGTKYPNLKLELRANNDPLENTHYWRDCDCDSCERNYQDSSYDFDSDWFYNS